jgi:hypothetical protein
MGAAAQSFKNDYEGKPMLAAQLAISDPAKLKVELADWEKHRTMGERATDIAATALRVSEFAADLIPGPGWVASAVLHMASSGIHAKVEKDVKDRIHAKHGSDKKQSLGKLTMKHATFGLVKPSDKPN